jgi:sec-independent protein translocase protein TatA
MSPMTIGLFGNAGLGEMLVLAFLGLLIFGKRLPEVGRSLGKGILEFKKGLSGVEDSEQPPVSRNVSSSQANPQQTRQIESTQNLEAAEDPHQGHAATTADPKAHPGA